LLINSNELTSLDGELPSSGHNLKMLYAVDNKLTHLPVEFRHLHRLETLFLQHNKIRDLDGTLQKARRLKFLELSYNELQEVSLDPDFRKRDGSSMFSLNALAHTLLLAFRFAFLV
jgi:Leucine-rich repeat (LRR) protein